MPALTRTCPTTCDGRQPSDEAESFRRSIRDHMEVLEIALKHSIDWSMRNRQDELEQRQVQTQPQQPQQQQQQQQQHGRQNRMEQMHQKVRDESHVRAFVTHFKIELNSLLGSDTLLAEPERCTHFLCERTRHASSPLPVELPTIKVDACDDSNEQQSGELESSQDSQNLQSHGGELAASPSDSSAATSPEEADDGYKSLNSAAGPNQGELAQQLTDIKARLIDLVHEIDLKLASAYLNPSLDAELDMYRRRRDALVAKLDELIERESAAKAAARRSASHQPYQQPQLAKTSSCLATFEPAGAPEAPAERQTALARNKTQLNLRSAYEEQEQVIYFDDRRRASAQADFRPRSVNAPEAAARADQADLALLAAAGRQAVSKQASLLGKFAAAMCGQPMVSLEHPMPNYI